MVADGTGESLPPRLPEGPGEPQSSAPLTDLGPGWASSQACVTAAGDGRSPGARPGYAEDGGPRGPAAREV